MTNVDTALSPHFGDHRKLLGWPCGCMFVWHLQVVLFRLVVLVAAILGGANLLEAAEDPQGFVGGEICASCHSAEAKSWLGSHHAAAMAHASESSVLGDFNDAQFEYFGTRSRFFRDNSKYLVETDSSSGVMERFEVKYTFGIEPLQQYLVEFADGRLQALPFAWDSRAKGKGGQRWLHLYPEERIVSNDTLHWTKPAQNWNFMCASCHSTNLHKNYDAANDAFKTTYSEISVGCEACHGPGSRHVAWARGGAIAGADKGLVVAFDERVGAVWTREPDAPSPLRKDATPVARKEVETCGLCHARSAEIKEDWIPGRSLSETHLVTPIERQLYSADGQMVDREETYNYGPFKQSRMFAAGVTCSDCHDPHSSKLRAPPTQTCLSCHAETLATPAHTHHQGGAGAPDCVSCHMPARTYMAVDVRHDHSFRIPRPDLSGPLGAPNACNDCHRDKSAKWAADAVERWFGPKRKGFQNYGPAFHSAWSDDADAEALLVEAARSDANPAIARASAMSALGAYPSTAAFDTAKVGIADPDPLVRIGALDALEYAPPERMRALVAPLLADPVLAVRLRAVWLLTAAAQGDITVAQREAFSHAAAEFEATQRLNADRPEARATLAGYFARLGRLDDAEREYEAARKLNRTYSPATIGLAEIYRLRGDEARALALLSSAAEVGDDGQLRYALGLALVRSHRNNEAVREFARAVELSPQDVRLGYTYAVALNSIGMSERAMQEVQRGLQLHPRDMDLLSAGMAFRRDAGDYASSLAFAERMYALAPENRDIAALVGMLRRRAKSTPP